MPVVVLLVVLVSTLSLIFQPGQFEHPETAQAVPLAQLGCEIRFFKNALRRALSAKRFHVCRARPGEARQNEDGIDPAETAVA